MSTAIVIIAAAAFVWRIYGSARALRSWWLAAVVTALAASVYFAPMFVMERSLWAMLAQLSAVVPRIFSVVFAIAMLAIGYSVSLFLDRARYGSRIRNPSFEYPQLRR